MKKIIFLFTGGIMLLLPGMISGCGSSEEPVTNVVSEEVSWKIGDTTVYATITHPENGKKRPAVLFIPGSGPTDRDWNSPLLPGTNGSAKLLAEVLAGQGFVTLRYDKRFAGTHAAENLPLLIGKISMESHLEEVRGAFDTLAARSDVDASRIFVLANSEGTLHAVNYQLRAGDRKFAGMILTGAPGQPVGEVMRSQIQAQLAGMPGADEILEMYDKAVGEFIDNGTMEPDPALPDGIKNLLLSLTNPANLPFTRELLTADIAPSLPEINEPVLVIIGKKDIQVDWQVDGAKLEAAAAGKENYTFSYPDNANHVLKYEAKPKNEINLTDPNYNGDDTILDAETLDIIEKWLEKRA